MSEFSKFDTQIHVEETSEYQPTAADLAEFAEWIDEQEAGEPELDAADWEAFDGHRDLYQEEFQLSAPEGWDVIEGDDSIGELSTHDGFEGEDWAEVDGQPDEYTEWQDYMGGDEHYDHSESMGEW